MTCAACKYDDEALLKSEQYILDNPQMFDKSYPHLKKYGSSVKPWIKLGMVIHTEDDISGRSRGMSTATNLLACPVCHTVKADL